ncbi:hypothetical protein BDC45DRAFT_511817 [Circinella umbellata]|nr:hypothetical protein BDC45DRAFT_511817 [Circinella umbellata]
MGYVCIKTIIILLLFFINIFVRAHYERFLSLITIYQYDFLTKSGKKLNFEGIYKMEIVVHILRSNKKHTQKFLMMLYLKHYIIISQHLNSCIYNISN